jgi:hypothetical protein
VTTWSRDDAPVPTGANGVNHVRSADNPAGYPQNVTSLRRQPPWLPLQSESCTDSAQDSGDILPVAAKPGFGVEILSRKSLMLKGFY